MKRCFISLDIPDNIKNRISEIQNKLPEFRGKKTEFENLHLTLKFLGEIPEEIIKKVQSRLEEIKFESFNAEVEKIGVFSENYVRIIWIKINNCEKLQEKIDSCLFKIGFEKEKRFMGHLTIARVKDLENKKEFLKELYSIEIPKLNFSVDRFFLKESFLKFRSPEYKTIKEIENIN